MMRLIGIDYGKKRIGIAVSDPLGLTAQPIEVFDNTKQVFEKINRLIEKYDADQIIVGMPKTLKGEIGQSAEEVLQFMEELKKHVNIPVLSYDERLTTARAQKILLDSDVSRKKRREVIDKIAAAYMLQGYMEKIQNPKS
jgi:putative Holliday junction resolvase